MNWKNVAGIVACAAIVLGVSGFVIAEVIETERVEAERVEPTTQQAPQPALVGTSDVEIVRLPEGYRDVATFCHQGSRVFVTQHENPKASEGDSAIAVVPADPSCATPNH